jgi:uncharacterized protein (DUF427 family)
MADEQRGRVRVEDSHKRVRVYLGGELVADTVHPRLVWEVPYFPAYYLPESDVRMELLSPTDTPADKGQRSPSRGDAHYFDVKGGSRTAPGAAWQYPDSPIERIRDHVRIDWHAMDHWFEEDEEVFTHPRDPYTRIDILPSSRHVRVEVNGETVAESRAPRILFETGLPPRYYLPLTDVRLDLLERSGTVTSCPYKGDATYWSVKAGGVVVKDLVWTYRTPLPESQKVAGMACFYNERVDLYVDGELQEQPRTKFS